MTCMGLGMRVHEPLLRQHKMQGMLNAAFVSIVHVIQWVPRNIIWLNRVSIIIIGNSNPKPFQHKQLHLDIGITHLMSLKSACTACMILNGTHCIGYGWQVVYEVPLWLHNASCSTHWPSLSMMSTVLLEFSSTVGSEVTISTENVSLSSTDKSSSV